jgi:hypothetical protein
VETASAPGRVLRVARYGWNFRGILLEFGRLSERGDELVGLFETEVWAEPLAAKHARQFSQEVV